MTVQRLQRGFTLIELMVAMVLGLLLMAGVLSVFLGSKRSYQVRDGVSVVQENGRVAIKRLQQGLSSAGYPANEGIAPVDIELSTDGDQLAGDEVAIFFRSGGYQSDRDIYTTNCLGIAVERGSTVTNRYFVESKQLYCEALYTNTTGGAQTTKQPLAEGIEAMQVLYGVDTDEDGVANRYINLTALDATDVPGIVALRIALLVRSLEETQDEALASSYVLLDQTVSFDVPDRFARQVFTTTIPLRNMMPLNR